MKDSRIKYDNKIWRVKEYTPFFFQAEVEIDMSEVQTIESDCISDVSGIILNNDKPKPKKSKTDFKPPPSAKR